MTELPNLHIGEIIRSFNVPELVSGKVKTNGSALLKTIASPAKNVNFELKN